MYLVHYIWVFTESRYTLRPRRIAITAELWLFAGVQERDGAYGLSSANPDCQTSPRTGSCAHRSSQTEGICLRHNARMSFGTSPSDPWKWKLSNGVGVTFRSKKYFSFYIADFPQKLFTKKIYNIIVQMWPNLPPNFFHALRATMSTSMSTSMSATMSATMSSTISSCPTIILVTPPNKLLNSFWHCVSMGSDS